MSENNKSFPKIAESNWWKLRELFKRKVPSVVTPGYLAAALSMTEKSAKANLIFPFKKLGIIDDDFKPTDLAYDWRDDNKYPNVCSTILKATYPQELRDLFHDKNQDFTGIINWFMNYSKCGEHTAKMYASFYRLLINADPSKQNQIQSKSKKSVSTKKQRSTKKMDNSTVTDKQNEINLKKDKLESKSAISFSTIPQLHINIQLHISPETTADQIDKIFESMAKHFKNLSNSESTNVI